LKGGVHQHLGRKTHVTPGLVVGNALTTPRGIVR
jgi:hypothetical protein